MKWYWYLYPCWDVHSKSFDRKHFLLNVMITEFQWGSFGFGFDWYYNKSAAAFNRSGNKYARLVINLAWVELSASLNFGNKPAHDATWKRLRENHIKLADAGRNVVN